MDEIYRGITLLPQYECLNVINRKKPLSDSGLHSHKEFELTLILYGKGIKRIVGDHTEIIDDAELVLVGSNLPHAWRTNIYKWKKGIPEVNEIIVQFHHDLFDERFLKRNLLFDLKVLLERSAKGIAFPKNTIERIKPKLIGLTKKKGFSSVLELLSILHELSIADNMRTLSNNTCDKKDTDLNGHRLEKVYDYINQNYDKHVNLKNASREVGMSEVSLSRLMKKNTGKTFMDIIIEIRLAHVSHLLINTNNTVSEIAYECGFSNLSYFNRVFRRKNGSTPTQYRNYNP